MLVSFHKTNRYVSKEELYKPKLTFDQIKERWTRRHFYQIQVLVPLRYCVNKNNIMNYIGT